MTTYEAGATTSPAEVRAHVVAKGHPKIRALIPKVIVVAIIIGLWQLSLMYWLPSYLPSPAGVVRKFVPTLITGDFLSAFGSTLQAIVVGSVVGCGAGIIIGLLSGRIPVLRRALAPYIDGLYALPIIVMVPTITIWLGYTSAARLALIIVTTLLPCAVSTADGVRLVPRPLLDVARVLRVSRIKMMFDIILPATLPSVVAGIQVAIGRAIVGSIAVEFIANLGGLGTFILINARSFHQDEAFVGLVILAVIGVLGRWVLQVLLQFLAPWRSAGTAS